MITTEEITKSYGRNLVLRGITFCAAAGKITLLVGPNGAGKSTTIKVLAGLIRPNSGNARINKIRHCRCNELRRSVRWRICRNDPVFIRA